MTTVATEGPEAGADGELRMSLADHLTELRRRLFRCTISVLVLGGASLVFAKEIFGILMRPVLVSLPPEMAQLVYTSAIEEINVYMKVGLYAGLFLSTPVILWQLWGFVSPGLYAKEKRLAGPFIVAGTAAFVVGALFCYFLLLPTMFTFLLREERSVEVERALETARRREQDALRFVRLGDPARAGQLASLALQDLVARAQPTTGDLGLTLVPKQKADVAARHESLGRLIDAAHDGFGAPARPVLQQVMEKHVGAAESLASGRLDAAAAECDEAAALLAGVAASHAQELGALWKLEKELAVSKARLDALNWTKPMLSMTEQLTLVLILELAFGVIFELPLVMAVLGMVGLVTSKFLFRYQRHALVVCLIVAAVITPTGDAVNLAMMAGPMLLCYELGVLLVWLVERRRKKDTAALANSE